MTKLRRHFAEAPLTVYIFDRVVGWVDGSTPRTREAHYLPYRDRGERPLLQAAIGTDVASPLPA